MGSELLALAKELTGVTSTLAKANHEKRLSLADYLQKIADCIKTTHAALIKGEKPHEACAELDVYLRKTEDILKEMLPDSDRERIQDQLWRAVQIRGGEISRMSGKYISYERLNSDELIELEQAVGNLRGLANALRAPEPFRVKSDRDFGKSPRGAGMKRYLDARGLRVLAALDTVATKVGTTPAQVALAWLIARPSITAPIASATSLVQLDEIIGGARLKLDEDAIKWLNEASA